MSRGNLIGIAAASFTVIVFIFFGYALWSSGGDMLQEPGEFTLNGVHMTYESYMCVKNTIKLYDVTIDGLHVGKWTGPLSCGTFDVVMKWEDKGDDNGR